jgi:hypothetical protein
MVLQSLLSLSPSLCPRAHIPGLLRTDQPLVLRGHVHVPGFCMQVLPCPAPASPQVPRPELLERGSFLACGMLGTGALPALCLQWICWSLQPDPSPLWDQERSSVPGHPAFIKPQPSSALCRPLRGARPTHASLFAGTCPKVSTPRPGSSCTQERCCSSATAR